MVAEQIPAAVRDGDLWGGERLPSARELAVQRSISRPSVREALSALKLTGAVETLHGEGTFVTESAGDLAAPSRSIPGIRQTAEGVQALEARRVIEEAWHD
jgi:GntR family transcriptional repressor for pyruvate dehydrogenase complex